MLKLNFIRNVGSVGADELIGRCKVPLKSICAKAGDRELVKAALGTEEYSNFEGCVRGVEGGSFWGWSCFVLCFFFVCVCGVYMLHTLCVFPVAHAVVYMDNIHLVYMLQQPC